jgi:tetratricopeptide (TPR) repeat protein
MSSTLLGCSFLAALGVGGFAGALIAARQAPPSITPPDPALAPAVAALTTDLETVKQRLASLEQRPADVERAPAPRSEPSTSAPPPPPKPLDPAAEKAAAVAAAAKELEAPIEQLLLGGVQPEELKKFLATVRAKGAEEGAIAAAQALVEKHPRDPKARYVLARACYARCMMESTPAGFEKWGGMTLEAWEKASELDPEYWEPRFERAEYLTYYPESEGKTPEVIGEFETLIEKQHGSSSNPRYAKSYAHLARMYLRVGKRDKAVQTLRDGSLLFPNDAELKKQLDVLQRE